MAVQSVFQTFVHITAVGDTINNEKVNYLMYMESVILLVYNIFSVVVLLVLIYLAFSPYIRSVSTS